MSEVMKEQFQKLVTTSSTVQLVAVNKNTELPESWGSGLLLKDKDKLLLVTVLHNALLRTTTIQGDLLFLDHRFVMRNRWVHGFSLIRSSLLDEDANTGAPYLDFTFAEVPVNDVYTRWSFDDLTGVSSLPLRRFSVCDVRHIDANELRKCRYSFCGTVEPQDADEKICGSQVVLTRSLYIPDLLFKDLDGEYYIRFQTPKPIVEYGICFAGSSGAPILDEEGRLVALVCGGEDGSGNERIVRAVRLDAIFAGLRDGSLLVTDLETNRSITNIAAVLLGMLDDDQRAFYWDKVDKGMIV